ncbi:hypothetical protein HEP85_10570 [Streptomyces sp. RPA4-2]|uniref:hypothetical protein n=1 Tax=Streptomyces sp. RPA4-2 TaxID=2721244 RepID=UPI00143E6392|nr:hypothetical protein [Streptomyces sp. RPA4-2]QIY60368.1 hypothetical protein HEP85_10570 [Streptomyces sp. RPA4-2]
MPTPSPPSTPSTPGPPGQPGQPCESGLPPARLGTALFVTVTARLMVGADSTVVNVALAITGRRRQDQKSTL